MADPRKVPLGAGLIDRARRALLGSRTRREEAIEVATRGNTQRQREAQTTDSNNQQ